MKTPVARPHRRAMLNRRRSPREILHGERNRAHRHRAVESFRLALCTVSKRTIARCLDLLGVSAPERM